MTAKLRSPHTPSPSGNATTLAATAVAVAGAATALWVNHRARVAEREHPPIGRLIDVDGVRLHFLERGAGSPVVLLHGNGVQLEDFIACGLFDRLAQRRRVIAFDRPGFGHSSRPRNHMWTPGLQALWLGKALTQLGATRPVVVGHSWGALVAMAMGLQVPEDVGGLVLLSGYYYPTARLDVPMNLPAAVPGVGDVLQHTALPILARAGLKRALRRMFAPAPVPADFLRTVPRELLVRPRQLRAAAEDTAFMIPAVTQMRREYARLRVPLTLFTGKDDRIVDPAAHTVRLYDELPRSQLRVASGGHMVHYAAPGEIADAVEALSVASAPKRLTVV
ncbi:alpha/beta fold hydrolase [Cupriavidus plantarum]|uniref:Pimeloyl-ACP methyl ester carboxylesterase n=1 Tax=Cupriavidus plantarum TaxID=942865 RepID=A0A316ER84_9BURK|nr:alpha/beta hydrolase [Cupriavidus plantarum]PWK34997.1 pimeloyl-ACP methyl ester carboxylesterase [Cupriavidus plantarum]